MELERELLQLELELMELDRELLQLELVLLQLELELMEHVRELLQLEHELLKLVQRHVLGKHNPSLFLLFLLHLLVTTTLP